MTDYSVTGNSTSEYAAQACLCGVQEAIIAPKNKTIAAIPNTFFIIARFKIVVTLAVLSQI